MNTSSYKIAVDEMNTTVTHAPKGMGTYDSTHTAVAGNMTGAYLYYCYSSYDYCGSYSSLSCCYNYYSYQ